MDLILYREAGLDTPRLTRLAADYKHGDIQDQWGSTLAPHWLHTGSTLTLFFIRRKCSTMVGKWPAIMVTGNVLVSQTVAQSLPPTEWQLDRYF